MDKAYTLGTWTPDQPDYNPGGPNRLQIDEVQNLYRLPKKWAPILKPTNEATTTEAFPGQPVRAWEFYFKDGTKHLFLESTDKHIYHSSSYGVWAKLSTAAGLTKWTLAQFGDAIYAGTGNQRLQKWEGTGSFAVVSGAPENVLSLQTVGSFLVAAVENKVIWSGLEKPDFWTKGSKSSGDQVLPDIGEVYDILGLEDGYIMCRFAVVRMVFVGGTFVFNFRPITRKAGTTGRGVSIIVDRQIYTASVGGLVVVDLDGKVEHLGAGVIDEEWERLVDSTMLDLASVFYDDDLNVIRWSFSAGEVFATYSFCYCTSTRAWSVDQGGYQLRFYASRPNMTWSDVAQRFGATFVEFSESVRTFQDSRLAGGSNILHGINTTKKMQPCQSIYNSFIVTKKFSPQRASRKSAIYEVRPHTDGVPRVLISTSDNLGGLRGADEAFRETDPLMTTGITPCEVNGRYFQMRFQFDEDYLAGYLSGFEIVWEDDGEL